VNSYGAVDLSRKAGKLGNRGFSELGARVKLKNYLTGNSDPFPWVSPGSTFNGTSLVSQLGTLGNDVWGDCVFAAYVHIRMLNAWLFGTQPVGNYTDYSVWPTDDQTITAYLTYNGSPDPTDHNPNGPNAAYDNGADPGEALAWFMTNPVGPLPPLEEDGGGWADASDFGEEYEGEMSVFGCTYNSVMVSQEAMNEFDAGQPWTSTATDFIGGHMIPHSYRDPSVGKAVTWGVEQPFSWPWWRVARVQTFVVLTKELLTSKVVNGAQLTADIKALGGTIG
jgi:hypothetical protein